MKRMQGGDFMGAIGEYGLDMVSYSSIANGVGRQIRRRSELERKVSRMMQS